jgi:hypothetical protein
MHKYAAAAAAAAAITLSLTMLTPAVSAGGRYFPLHEEGCDGYRPDWGRTYAIRCHCDFECSRKYSYTLTLPCSGGYAGYVSKTRNGLCDVTVHPVEEVRACMATCVKAREAAQH